MIVVKLGGSAGIDQNLTLDDLARLWPEQPVLFIHGANAALDDFMRSQGKEPTLVTSTKGQVSRFTDQQTMDDMLAIYAGRTNKRIVEGLQARGVNAVGLSAMDGGIAKGRRKDALRIVENGKSRVLRGDYAGSLTAIDPTLPNLLLANGYLPVITPPAISTDGEAINVDGDKLALQIALAVEAKTLIYLSNTAGLLADPSDPDSLITDINVDDADSVDSAMNAAAGRMKKKVEAGVNAVTSGIPTVIFANGCVEDPVTRALNGEGTSIVTAAMQEV